MDRAIAAGGLGRADTVTNVFTTWQPCQSGILAPATDSTIVRLYGMRQEPIAGFLPLSDAPNRLFIGGSTKAVW
jgi:hypothetical protein